MLTNELREKYLAFFETKGCVRRPSDVLIPRWDPSVLFTPAGMNQFKDHFLGRCKLEFTRATTCQKCLRTGDIDNVGRTAYHHTFFEMLGNFSFGDYFKREAITWAWEFLTSKEWLALEPGKLSATVYKDDQEAADIWIREVGLPSSKVKFMEEDENFWPASAPSLGPDGVCGPCSEIYYQTPFGEVEIWNLVFTQFNRVGNPPDNLRPLPSKNIDTGMGLERTAAVLQGVETNYHIDILLPIVEAAAEVLGVKYVPEDDNGRRLRRITDHVRACTFAVHENVYPGNKEEKYVIRRLLRRAVLDGRQIGTRDPFLYKLVPVVAQMMKVPYPEISETIPRVEQIIKGEEENFLSTIDNGLEKMERIFDAMKSEKRTLVGGSDIFDLYQTYGYPPELFETFAVARNYGFDWEGYKREMERHGEISGTAERGALFKDDPLAPVKKQHGPTQFLGYDTLHIGDAKILAIVSENTLVSEIERPGTAAYIVLDKTPFYGEKGGQVGDRGELTTSGGAKFLVDTTQCDGDFTVHIGRLDTGTFRVGDTVTAVVEPELRQRIRMAHTATHLLHYVLRQTLGSHAEQQGSKVDDGHLRFDFTHPEAVSRDDLATIEREVNRLICEALPIESREMGLAEARATGAMMLFGEKYPERVRVVSMGQSRELCGGTHLSNTSEVGLFKILAESSVAAGTRRIEGLVGMNAVDYVLNACNRLASISQTLKVTPDDVPVRVESLLAEVKKLKKSSTGFTPKQDKASIEAMIAGAGAIGETHYLIETLEGGTVQAAKTLVDTLREKLGSAAVFFVIKQPEDKLMLLAALTRDLVVEKHSASTWVNAVAAVLGGKGGGRPDMAQAGGRGHDKIPAVRKCATDWIESQLRAQ